MNIGDSKIYSTGDNTTMRRTSVTPISEVAIEISDDEEIAFQKAVYNYGSGKRDIFYRFIRKKDGKLKAQRGQCGIPDLATAKILIEEMAQQERENSERSV